MSSITFRYSEDYLKNRPHLREYNKGEIMTDFRMENKMSSDLNEKIISEINNEDWPNENRINNIGQNGNDGKHYTTDKPGVKYDANKVEMELIITGFPRALKEVGRVATFGKNKYSRGGFLEVDDGINRYTSAMIRHLLADAEGEELDPEMGLPHLAAVAWNALAVLELELRRIRE